jgi:hypothetical protein
LIAHGWVNAGVTTCHAMTRFPCQGGQTSHEGAANAQYVYMHGGILGGAQWRHGRFNR